MDDNEHFPSMFIDGAMNSPQWSELVRVSNQIRADLDAIHAMAPSLDQDDVWKRCITTIYPNSQVVRGFLQALKANHRPHLAFTHEEIEAIWQAYYQRITHPSS